MKSISGKTKVTGLIGYPVEHSFSPAMHNAAFGRNNLDYVYVPFCVKPEELSQAAAGIRGLNLAGVNVTIPHKAAIMEFLDDLAPEAKLIGAVNTIVVRDGKLIGHNTDAPGFVAALRKEAAVEPAGKQVTIIGAGGAARAVAIQLALEGVGKITLSSPFPKEIIPIKKAITSATATLVAEACWDETAISMAAVNSDIVINTTPLGMHPNTNDMPPISFAEIPEGVLVCDLIYNPGETMFLKKAKEQGLPVMNGIGMLLYQGVIAFELWTGSEAPVETMRKVLLKAVKGD
ncbi:shikimate dehydrogenase [Phosphitispora sp. TUW77]|uniref:shikimate dehydrogenase n=1 Tax=Phosphitispora sp. TUW77 TaxID=3152361 RepID=UPI003AB86791